MRNRIETTIGITVITWLFAGGIAIAQPPVAEFTSDITSGCFPITVNFTDLSTNSPTSWDWDFGNSNGSTLQNPSAVYSAAGFYTVTLIACIGVVCDTIIKTNYISAYNYPIADFTASVTYGCAPLTMQFFDISTPVSSPITSWNWDFGDGFSSTLANPIHTYATPDVYNVSLGIADGLGCTDSKFASNYIIVSTPPTLTYTVDNAYSCTSPLNVTFTNTSTQGTYPVSSWFWLFGDGFSSTNADPVHNYATSGSYTVQLIATDSIGCSILMTDSNAIVVGSDSATFTYTTTRTCTELQVSFFGTSNPNIMSWSWNFGDGSPIQGGQNVSHNYTSSGTFIVTLTTVNVGACPDTSSKVLSYQVTTGSFSTDTTYACSLPFAVSYSGAASGNPPFSYQWDFSYNSFGFNFESSLQNPTYVYTYEDTFDVMMVVTDVFGCTDSISLMGTGDSIWTLVPDPQFATDPWQGCIPLFVSFTDFSDAGMGSIASWAWNFDDTVSGTNNLSSLQNPTHIFDSIGQYDVTLTITNNLGCSAIEQRLVRSGYPPLADSITTSLAIACHGEPVLLSAFSADTNVNGGIWDYGDGISGGGWPTVIHEFQDTGMLIIEFTPIFNGCEGTPIYDSIYIRPPKPIFTPSPSFICRSPATVTFVNTSWEADNSIWDFGDGSPIEFTVSPVHTFTTPGRHSVLLTVTNANGCRDSLFRSIDIPEPTANFTNTPSIGCVPLKVNFNDASFTYIPISYPIVSWWWDFGDGFTSTVRSPSHTYTTAGIFTVTHVITDNMGCTDTLIKVDEIITSTSTAEFSGTPLVGCEGLTVNFTDLSTQYSPIVAWSWDFGDGSPANSSASPTYSYPTSGTYTVQLTITDSIGCVNTMSKAPYVYITKPNPQFTHPAKTCVDQPISFVNTTSGGGLTFLWDFDDTNTSTSPNPVHTYPDSGLYTITLTATDTNGCVGSNTSQYRAVGRPIVNFVVDTFYAVCPPLIVQFTDLSTSDDDTIVSWLWDFGDTSTTIAQNPIHTFVYPNSFDINLTVTNSTGCVGFTVMPDLITVAGPSGSFTFTPDVGCVPMLVSFSSTTANADIYHWDFGNGVVDTVSGGSITHTYTQPGYPTPQLSLTDSMGCKLPATAPVPTFLTLGEVVADFSLTPTTVVTPFCPEDTVFFSDSSYTLNDSTTIIAWIWNFGDGFSSSLQNPTHVYTAAGTYIISLTAFSSLGCNNTTSNTVTIIYNDTLVLKAIITGSVPASCYEGSDGQATADGLSGTAPYTFLWGASAGNQTTALATGLSAGSHSVLVTDINGCTDTISVVVGEPPEPSIIFGSITNVTCFGFSNGSIPSSAAGGTPGYVYLWDVSAGSQTTALADSLIAGVYVLTVTDINGCPFSDSATVTEPTKLAVSTDTTDVLCNGGSTGTATAIPVGATPSYLYQWDTAAGSQTTATATGLIAGSYWVTVTDANACVDSAMAVVVEPAILGVILDSITNVSCNGFSDGSIAVSGSGGVAPYSYQWDAPAGNQTTALADSLIAGVYSLIIADSNACLYNDTFTVTEPTAIVIVLTTTDVSCEGGSDGTATASTSGGFSPYSYLWGASAGSQTTATATGLMAGPHSVTVTDSTGCSDSATTLITEPDSLGFAIDSITNVSCFGFLDGRIFISATDGTPPYSYLWDAAAGSQTTAAATGLIAGLYSLTVTDSLACTFTDSVTVTEPTKLLIATDSTDVLCNGGSTGTATANPSGATPPYTYLWDVAAGNQTTATATGLAIGTYGVTVTDSNACVDSAMVLVNEPAVLNVITDSITNVSCYGFADGSIAVSPTGGVTPYSYLWDASAGSQTTALADSLIAGLYTIIVTDSNGCIYNDTSTVTQPTEIIISLNITDVSCNGDSDGTATASAIGGFSPYVYLWGASAGNQTSATATGLIAGLHTVTVTDSTGCSDTAVALVTEPAILGFTVDSIIGVSCTGLSDGGAAVTAIGGTTPYSYLWDAAAGSQTTDTATALIAGVYALTVTDSLACTFTDSITVTEPLPITVVIDSTTDVLCNGDSSGTATANPAGGTTPYSYLWGSTAGSQTTATATGLAAATYDVTVTDINGCTADTSGTVVEPAALADSIIEIKSSVCNGVSEGELDIQVWGGELPYSYLWTPGNFTSSLIDNLPAGTYTIVVSDSNNCQISDSVTIFEPTPLELGLDDNGMDTVCYNVVDSLDAQPTGSLAPYTYSWTDGTTTLTGNPIEVIPVDPVQTWTVTVTDSAGCTSSDSIDLFVNFIEVDLIYPDTVCFGSTATLTAEANGTLPGFNSNYSYQWSTSDTSSSIDISVFASTNFSVTVTDGCSASDTASVTVEVFIFPTVGIKASPYPVCPGELITFSDTVNSISGATHFWDFGDGNTASGLVVQHAYAAGGIYYPSVTVTTPIGCALKVTSQIGVVIYATPTAFYGANPFVVTLQNPTIDFQDMSYINPILGDVIVSYFWEFGDGATDTLVNPTHTYQNMGSYAVTLTVTTQFGCEGVFSRFVIVDPPDIDLLIPSAFTPNATGSSGGTYDPSSFDNDVFYPITTFVEEYDLQVFNRWGELVFVSNDLQIGWDGYYKEKLSQQDTYIWKLKIVWITGKEYEDVGRVLLIR